MVKYCPHCGSEVQEGTKYCSSCGKELVKQKKSLIVGKKQYIIIAEAVIIIALIVGVGAYGVTTYFNNNMKIMDFGAFTMSVPSDANLVSNTTYNSISGSFGWNDNPNDRYSVYYDDLTTFSGSAVASGSHVKVISGVEQLTSDKLKVNGNCTIYRHVKDGKDEFWAYYEVDKYAITVKADTLDHLISMLNSIQIKSVSSSSSSSSSGSGGTKVIIINDSTQDNSTTNTDEPTPVTPVDPVDPVDPEIYDPTDDNQYCY